MCIKMCTQTSKYTNGAYKSTVSSYLNLTRVNWSLGVESLGSGTGALSLLHLSTLPTAQVTGKARTMRIMRRSLYSKYIAYLILQEMSKLNLE
jgi:hypothetical protein